MRVPWLLTLVPFAGCTLLVELAEGDLGGDGAPENPAPDAVIDPSADAGVPDVHLQLAVAVDSDDAEEGSSGSVDTSSQDLELGLNESDEQTVGLRFVGAEIPAGAIIAEAYLQFTAQGSDAGEIDLVVSAQASDAARTFVQLRQNISDRPRGVEFANWPAAAWTDETSGEAERTPNISHVVQEVIDRAGWTSGNPIVFFLRGQGERVAHSFDDDPASAAVLHILY